MLGLTNHEVKQLTLSLNHQNSGEEKVPYLSIAYTEVHLDKEKINGAWGVGTWESWFNVNGKEITPMPWTKSFVLKTPEAFKDVAVDMLVNGNKELEFTGCRLYFDDLKLLSGGTGVADIHIHVIEHKESDMIQIRRAEFSTVKLSLGEGVLIERKSRGQRELPLGPDPDADKDGEGEQGRTTTPVFGHVPVRDETHVWWQHGETEEKGNGKRCDMPAGCIEIDPPAGGKSEREQIEAELGQTSPEITGDGSGTALPAVDDNAQFAEGAARAVGAHMKKGRRGVVDGRSEKHQDRQSGKH